jgi:hypothetical protein
MRPLLILVILASGCGETETETVRIALRSPQALDPAQVASVGIAAIRELSTSCVTGAGSNQCASIQTLAAATQSPGFVRQITLTPAGGSSGFLDELPFGRTCFVAEALSANQTSLASGCAEVTLTLEKQKVEIELQSP